MKKYKPRTMLHTFEDLRYFVSLPLKIREKIRATMTYHTFFYFYFTYGLETNWLWKNAYTEGNHAAGIYIFNGISNE